MLDKIKLFILNNKKILLLILSILILLVLGFLGYHYKDDIKDLLYKDNIYSSIVYKDKIYTEYVYTESNVETEEYITVDIKGSVNKPGIYKLDKNKDRRVFDVIEMAGGLKVNANTSLINLAKKTFDEMVIIIYSNEDLIDNDKEKTCSQEQNACIKENDSEIKIEEKKDEIIDTSNIKININKANITELQQIPGIGESKAKSIIEYREKNGDYKTIEDIKNVTGIGDSLYEKIKEYIDV